MQGKLRSKSKAAREVELLARLATYEAALREIEAETQRDTLNPRSVLQSVGIIAREALDAP